jgi:hypothetical protein
LFPFCFLYFASSSLPELTSFTVCLSVSLLQIIPIITEIALANRSLGGGTIVILSEQEKEAMEQEIADADLELHGTQIVCRRSPSDRSAVLCCLISVVYVLAAIQPIVLFFLIDSSLSLFLLL